MNPTDQPAPHDPIPNIPPPPVTPSPDAPPPVVPGGPPPPYPEPPLGATAGSPPPYTGVPGVLTPDEKNWALAAHMSALIQLTGVPSLVGPLVVWLIKRDTMPFVNEHGKEALNFQLTQWIVLIGACFLSFTCIGAIIAIPLAIVDLVFLLVMAVVAGLKAGNGELYRYPLTWRIIK
jgi:uncharacterized Tic20 family protein